MRNRFRSGLACLLVVTAPLAPTPAAAEDPFEAVRTFWTEYNVPDSIQDELVEKLVSTGKVDAFESDATPISVETIETDLQEVTVFRFGDGSVVATTLQKPIAAPGAVAPFASIAECTTTSGSGYATFKNCAVGADNGIFRIGFRVTYERYASAYAKILSSSGAHAVSGTGTITAPTRVMWRPQASPTLQAVVKYHSDYTAWSNLSSQDVYLGFWLTSSGAASTSQS